MSWVDIEATEFHVENVPVIDYKNKLFFDKWLEKQGDDWAEDYTQELEKEYESYYYDGLPKFVRKYL